MSKGADAREDNDGAWFLDQVGKSEFFHQQLHAWGMLEVAKDIEGVQGEGLDWDCATLRISQKAWNRVVHRGIKPVVVFAHPDVLVTIAKATSYYRTLAMVSQKSMARVGLATQSYESGTRTPAPGPALRLARHLNRVISVLIEADETVDAREFDLWRGMAAGTQAQGAWQNIKGDRAEALVKGFVMRRLAEREGHVVADEMGSEVAVSGGLVVRFGDEPDIAVRRRDKVIAAVEVKGGIDAAGVLERIGAAVKTLSRVKDGNPAAVTVLLLQGVSVTESARHALDTSRQAVNCWFTIEDFVQQEATREEVYELLSL